MKNLASPLLLLLLFAACGQEISEEYSHDITELFPEISLSEELNLYVDEDGQPVDGHYSTTYEDGSDRADITFRDGMISEGEIFREDGYRTVGYSTENGMMTHTLYAEDDQPRLISVFGDDLSDRREFHVWYDDGTRFVESDQTINRMWYESGQLQSEVPLTDGRMDGKAVFWHENGEIKAENHFTDDEMDGTFTEWDEEGNIVRERVYDMGELVSGE